MLPIVYVPSAAVVAEPWIAFDTNAWTDAPLTAVPSLDRVTVPVMDPVPTVNVIPLLDCPPTVTITEPVVALEGTGTTIWVGPQFVGVAPAPENTTVLCPCVAPKFCPLIMTDVPAGPEEGETAEMDGANEKETPLLEIPPTVTTTRPVVAEGAGAVMLEPLQAEGAAGTPLKVTVLAP